jgi:hypothetical protein
LAQRSFWRDCLVLHCRVVRKIEIHRELAETREKVAAALPALNRAQEVVLARAEQERELVEALLDREAVDQLEAAPEAAEAALGEADHRLALQNLRSHRCATIFLLGSSISYVRLIELIRLGEVSALQHSSCVAPREAVKSSSQAWELLTTTRPGDLHQRCWRRLQ